MRDEKKTKQQLISELMILRQRVAQLEASEVEHKQLGEITGIIEGMLESVGIIGFDGTIYQVNSEFERGSGWRREEIVGKNVIELGLISKEEAQRIENEIIPNLIKEGFVQNIEMIITRRDGTKFPVLMSWALIKDAEGKPVNIINVARDITERKYTEEKYRQLVEDMNDGYGVIQEEKYVFANRRLGEILGCDPEQVLGKSIDKFMVPEDRQQAMDSYKRVIHGTEAAAKRYEGETIRGDGTKIVIEASSRPIQYEGKPAIGVIVRDITEPKRAESILRESEEKLRFIFESVPEGIIVSNLRGKIQDVNNGVIHMHGYDTKEELIGRSWLDLIGERENVRAKEDTKKTLEKGHLGITRYTFVKKDGSEFPAALRVAVLRDTAGQPSGFVTVTEDVTELQKMQEQLMLADRLVSIGQLAAGIAHEINNPLTSIIGFSELLLEKDLSDEIKEDLGIIDKEAKRAANVVRGLLTFARGKGSEKMLININSIIQEVLQLRSYEQKISNIKVDVRFAPDLPQVIGSGAQMQQVFMNLIVNAEQAMLEAHGGGKLKVTTEKTSNIIRVSIDDNGPGISPENMKRLFTPFFTTKEVGKGTGLGLSICHGVVTEHGGRTYAESELGKGASFILELPIPAG